MKFIPGFYKLGVWIMSELVQATTYLHIMWYCKLTLCNNKEYIQWRNLDFEVPMCTFTFCAVLWADGR